MKTLRKSFFSLMLLILIKTKNLNFIIAILTQQLQFLSQSTLTKTKKIQYASTLQWQYKWYIIRILQSKWVKREHPKNEDRTNALIFSFPINIYNININTKLLKSILCTLKITKKHTWISQGVLDLVFSFQHLRLGSI